MPSASSLAQGGLGSGGSLPSSIPGASLLPNPIPGNYRSQVAQGQALFQAAQNAAAGTPGSVATLLQGAATTIGNDMSNGLPKTIIMDVAGIAAGYAMGGPVGAAVGVASAAIGLFSSLLSSAPAVWEGYEAIPSDASTRNWSLVQNYIANLVGSSQSGYPPGWYLAYYQAATAAPYTLSDLTDLFLLRNSSFKKNGGDSSALAYLLKLQQGGLKELSIQVGYTADSRNDPMSMQQDVPWKTPNGWPATPPTTSGYQLFLPKLTGKNYPSPKDTQFQALMVTKSAQKSPFEARWIWDGMPTVPLAFLWGDPTGQGLPGSLANGFTGVMTPGAPTTDAFATLYNQTFPGPVGTDGLPAGQGLAAFFNSEENGTNFLRAMDVHWPMPFLPIHRASIWSQALSDLSDKPGMTRRTIAAKAMKLAPRNIWFDPSLYQMYATDNSGNLFTALYNLDILNALATIWVMSAVGAHPRAITTELLVQQANIYEHGGPNPGVQNLSVAYRRFMDEWLNISQGYPPDNHTPVLGQMSADAPPEAKATHVQNLSTLSQWVQHYLG